MPADKIVEATSGSGAVVTWSAPTATDIVDGAVTPVCTPASGSTFPLGVATVSITATDAAGNSSSSSFKVTVKDTTAPSIAAVPADILIEPTSGSGAVVTWAAPTATDLVDGAVTPVCTPASGSTLPLGVTTVSITATDTAGNSSSKSFKVTVKDTIAPAISGVPADRVVEATGPSGAVVTWIAPTALDAVNGAVTVVCAPAPGSTFPLGETIVSVSAADAAGNSSTRTFKITVAKRILAKLASIHFAFNSPSLSSQAKRELRAFARTLAKGGYTFVSLRGYTSDQPNGGTLAHRKRLALNRAKNVKSYLAAQLKSLHASPKIIVAGHGPANPVASNKSGSGRAKNRRVEIWAK